MSFYNKKTSVSRDFLLLSIILIILVGIISIWVSYRTYENYVRTINNDIKNESANIDDFLINKIKYSTYLLESLGRQIVQNNDTKSIVKLLNSFYDSNKEFSDEISWLDKSQNILINNNNGLVEQKISLNDRDYVKKSLTAPWQVHIGRPNNSKITNQWLLPLSLGITDYKGDFIGTLVFGINISQLTKELHKMIKLPKADFGIFTTSLNVITDSNKLSNNNSSLLESSQINIINQQLEKKKSVVLSTPDLFNRERSFSYFEKSKQFGYYIYINYKPNNDSSKIVELLQARLVQVFIIFLFLLSMIWMVKTRVIKPVEKLCEVALKINSGGKYVPISKGGPVEIERLAIQIKKISDYLNEQNMINQELKLKNNHLNRLKENYHIITKAHNDFVIQYCIEMQNIIKIIDNKIIKNINDNNKNKIDNNFNLELIENINFIKLIINDINEASRSENDLVHLREHNVNINFLLHRAVRKFHEYITFKHIDVKLKVDESIPNLISDESYLIKIILYILCGISYSINQGSGIELLSQIEYNEHNQKELVLQFKFSASQYEYAERFINQQYENNRLDKNNFEPKIKSTVVNFLIAKMLVSILNGNMSINTNKDESNRIFIKFPQDILIQPEQEN
jgi:hypothetical protein